MDDGFTGGKAADIERMVGTKDTEGNYNGTMSNILALGVYRVKEYVIEGDMDQADKNLLSNAVFGHSWDPKSKCMKMMISLNLSKKKRSVRVLPDLKQEDLKDLINMKMTKRNLLGITNSFG